MPRIVDEALEQIKNLPDPVAEWLKANRRSGDPFLDMGEGRAPIAPETIDGTRALTGRRTIDGAAAASDLAYGPNITGAAARGIVPIPNPYANDPSRTVAIPNPIAGQPSRLQPLASPQGPEAERQAFSDRYSQGAPDIGGVGYDQYNAFLRGELRIDQLTAPNAIRAARAHYQEFGNPQTRLARSRATAAAEQRANAIGPSGLSPNEELRLSRRVGETDQQYSARVGEALDSAAAVDFADAQAQRGMIGRPQGVPNAAREQAAARRGQQQEKQRQFLQSRYGVDTPQEAIEVRRRRREQGMPRPRVLAYPEAELSPALRVAQRSTTRSPQSSAATNLAMLQSALDSGAVSPEAAGYLRQAANSVSSAQFRLFLNDARTGRGRTRQPTIADLDRLVPPPEEVQKGYAAESDMDARHRRERALREWNRMFGSGSQTQDKQPAPAENADDPLGLFE